jgi:hypothetical protein
LIDRIIFAINSVYEGEFMDNCLDQSCLTEIFREYLKPELTLSFVHPFLDFLNIIDIPDKKSTEMVDPEVEDDPEINQLFQQAKLNIEKSTVSESAKAPLDLTGLRGKQTNARNKVVAPVPEKKPAPKKTELLNNLDDGMILDRPEFEELPNNRILNTINNNNNNNKRGEILRNNNNNNRRGNANSMRKDMNSTLSSAILSSNNKQPYNGAKFQSPEEERISYNCEHVNAKDFQKIGDVNEDFLVYIHKSMSTYDESRIPEFAAILSCMCQLFGLNLDTTRIFVENGDTIAYNQDGALFFNYFYFLKLGLPKGEVLSFWFMVFCHEIAHNVHREHNADHEGVSEWMASHYMHKLLALGNLDLETENFVFQKDGKERIRSEPVIKQKRKFPEIDEETEIPENNKRVRLVRETTKKKTEQSETKKISNNNNNNNNNHHNNGATFIDLCDED